MPPILRKIMNSDTQHKSTKKPFKWTRDLVRLALHDSWTQQEIADKCRTQQSVVSSWNKGTKLATEQQLMPLLDIYGYKLRRNTFKIYWSLNTETNEKIFYRVEGKVILSLPFHDPRRSAGGKLIKKVPVHKLVIHHQGKEQFRAVIQGRLKFKQTNEELECSIVDGIWNSEISEPMSLPQLVEFVDRYVEEKLKTFPSDATTLPFLIRQALLNHGIPINGIVEYPAVW